jgi:hypothetical protein
MRNYDDSYDDDYSEARANLWEAATKRALTSKRGLATLSAVEAALVGLHSKRLGGGALVERGEVCVLGAYILSRAPSRLRATLEMHKERERIRDYFDSDGTPYDSAEFAKKRTGIAITLASILAAENDAMEWETPEQRYDRILGYVRTLKTRAEIAVARSAPHA